MASEKRHLLTGGYFGPSKTASFSPGKFMGAVGGGTEGASGDDATALTAVSSAVAGSAVGQRVFSAVLKALASSSDPEVRAIAMPASLLAAGVSGEVTGRIIKKFLGKTPRQEAKS